MEDKTKFKLRNLPIPDFLYKENDITLVATKTYSFIHAYTNRFFFGNEHLAEMFGCSTQAVSDAIKVLEKKGYIHCQYRPKAGGGKTRLVIDDYLENKQMTNRDKNTEATTSHQRLDKEVKDNNLKENFFNDSFSTGINDLTEREIARQERRENTGKTFGYKTPKETKSTSKRNFTPLNEVELWELAKELNVPPYEPVRKQKEILEAYEDGSLPEKYGNTLSFVIKKFIRRGKEIGQIETLDEMGRMALEADHPDKVAERERIWREAEERGIV